MMAKKRLYWIDVARGIAILLVVLGHCIGNLNAPGNKFILSFHMPLFFFISGLCAKSPTIKFGTYLKKKARALLIPQCTLGVINCVFDLVLGEIYGIWSIIYNFFGWFLWVMFFVSLVFYALSRIGLHKRSVMLTVLLADIVAVILMELWGINTVIHFEIVPMALLFYLTGFIYRSYMIGRNVHKYAISSAWLICISITVLCSYWNTPVTMYSNDYGNLILFFIGAFSGIIFMCGFAKGLKTNRFLIWFGQSSVIVYVLHFKLINVLHFIGKLIFPSLSESNYLYPANWHYFLLSVLLLIPAVYICNRWFKGAVWKT